MWILPNVYQYNSSRIDEPASREMMDVQYSHPLTHATQATTNQIRMMNVIESSPWKEKHLCFYDWYEQLLARM